MARPKKDGLEYFAHDVDASNDEKIESMEAIYGASGYAFYFKLVERIYRNGGALDVSAAETRQILARKCLAAIDEWEKMLGTALRVGLFDSKEYEERQVLTSDGIKRRCSKVFEKREKMAKIHGKQVSAAETPPETCQEPDKAKESKVKESKVNENVVALKSEFDAARKSYPGTKGGLETEWKNFEKKYAKEAEAIIQLLAPAIVAEKEHKARLKDSGQFVPSWKNFQTWINNRCWEQELGETGANNGQPGKYGANRRESRAERLDRDATDFLRELRGTQGGNPPPDQQDVFECESGTPGA